MLISFLSLNLIVFSQGDTNSTGKKCFPTEVVKEIAKDLMRGDSAKEQLSITQKILLETEKKCETTDSINTILRKKEQNYQEIILNSDEKYNTLQVYTTKVETKLRNEVLKNKLTNVISGTLIMGLTLLLISR